MASPVVHFGSGKSPEEAQHQRFTELMPPQLGGDGEWTGTVRVAKIRVWADDDYRAQNVEWQRKFDDELEYVNAVLTGMCGVKLAAEYHVWRHHDTSVTLDAALDALAREDPGDGAFAVVGLTSALSLVTATVEQLGLARLPGRHLVLRGYAYYAEREAFAQMFKDLRADERDALHEARRRHKTTAVFLHELGHNLGVAHETMPDTIMNAMYSDHAASFSEAARETIRASLDERLGGGAPARPRAAPPAGAHDSLVIAVAASGETAVDGRALDAPALDELLRARFARDRDTEVVIKMAGDVPHGVVIELINRAKAAGMQHLSLETE